MLNGSQAATCTNEDKRRSVDFHRGQIFLSFLYFGDVSIKIFLWQIRFSLPTMGLFFVETQVGKGWARGSIVKPRALLEIILTVRSFHFYQQLSHLALSANFEFSGLVLDGLAGALLLLVQANGFGFVSQVFHLT